MTAIPPQNRTDFSSIFKGKPLINTAVTLETHNTPAQTYTTDQTGAFSITLPE
jgi:hypothetical protein